MGNTFAAFLVALRMMESGGDYGSVNTLDYLGGYQFGEAALTDLGYVRYDGNAYNNDYSGGFTGKHGIRSLNQFLSNREVQDRAAQDWMRLLWRYIKKERIEHYAGKTVGGVELTASGMLAASHLLGADALRKFIESRGRADLRDPYGTPMVKYIEMFGGYDVPFAAREDT